MATSPALAIIASVVLVKQAVFSRNSTSPTKIKKKQFLIIATRFEVQLHLLGIERPILELQLESCHGVLFLKVTGIYENVIGVFNYF